MRKCKIFSTIILFFGLVGNSNAEVTWNQVHSMWTGGNGTCTISSGGTYSPGPRFVASGTYLRNAVLRPDGTYGHSSTSYNGHDKYWKSMTDGENCILYSSTNYVESCEDIFIVTYHDGRLLCAEGEDCPDDIPRLKRDSNGDPIEVPMGICEDYVLDNQHEECHDGIFSPWIGEEAIDCGGICAPCPDHLYCPEGTTVFMAAPGYPEGHLANACMEIRDPDAYGNCPPGTGKLTHINDDGSYGEHHEKCGFNVAWASIYESNQNVEFDSKFPDGGSFSIVEMIYPETVTVDPETGNKTTIQESTKTQTDANGKTTTTNTTRTIVTDSDGNIISDTTSTNQTSDSWVGYGQGDAAMIAGIGDVNKTLGEIKDGFGEVPGVEEQIDETLAQLQMPISEEHMPEKKDIFSMVQTNIAQSPIGNFIGAAKIEPTGANPCLTWNYQGKPVQFCFDAPQLTAAYAIWRPILSSIVLLACYLYLFGYKGD